MKDNDNSLSGRTGALAVERTVQVEVIEGEYAWVIADRMSACKACAERKSCGQATLNGAAKPTRIKVLNTLGLVAGDWVVIAVPSIGLFRSMMLAYGLPLMGFLVGGSVGAGHSDIGAIVLACVGLGLGVVVSRNRVSSGGEATSPEMVRHVPPPHMSRPPVGSCNEIDS